MVFCFATPSDFKTLAFEVRDYLKAHPNTAIVNLGCGLKQGALNHAETLREAEKASANLVRLVKTCIREI